MSSLSSSPDKAVAGVHFDLSAGGTGSLGERGERPLFKRSLSMAELAAAELVREEDRTLDSEESQDAPNSAALERMYAEAAAELQQHKLPMELPCEEQQQLQQLLGQPPRPQ